MMAAGGNMLDLSLSLQQSPQCNTHADAAGLIAAVNPSSNGFRQLVVLKGEQVVVESYASGMSATTTTQIYSVTKSFSVRGGRRTLALVLEC
jgi:hypothetical protein